MSNRRLEAGAGGGGTHAAAPLRPLIFTTAGLRAQDQFAAYAARCAGVVEVEPVGDPRAGFAIENRLWKLGGAALSCVETGPVRYARTPDLVRRDPMDHWTIAVMRQGGSLHEAGGRAGILPAGRIQLGTMAAPFAGRRESTAWQMLFLDRDSFPELADRFDGAVGTMPGGALAGVLGDFLLGLEGHLDRATEAERPALAASIRAMVAACLAPNADRLDQAAGPLDQVLLDRARAVIRHNLGASLLGPRMLCRELGLSRSRLYRLFEPMGGVACFIQRQRLLAARAALADPGNAEPIGRLAERLGFADPSVFSRAYRAEFDQTPRETRLAGRAGLAPTRAPLTPVATPEGGLRDLLRRV